MSISLLIENLTKSYGDRMIFSDFTLGVNEGDKIGIIAKNGAGKSTLLRILAGKEDCDSGKITLRSGLRIGFLEQESIFKDGTSVLEACLDAAPEPENLSHHDETFSYRDRMAQMLSQLGISDPDALTSNISGGWRKRAALACTLVSNPDILLLDEPTNHLDIPTVEWLENYLRRARITLLMVTHDRYFLDRVCNKIIEIDREQIYLYEGNYDYYLRRRSERIEAMSAQLAKVKNTLRREQEWMSRQPQARGTKQSARIDRFHALKDASKVSLNERQLTLNAGASYIGSKIFEAEHISKRFGDKVILKDFSYTFARGEKIGIVGPNGVGKTTFIKMLLGLEPQDSGEWNVGSTVRFGHYSQEGIALDSRKKVIDAVTDIAEDIELNDGVHISPSQLLSQFLFPYADQQKFIYKLSGGERRRLNLAITLMRRPNFLILDEPTNDLDIVTLGLLEDYLARFEGCAIVISHDRYFLDNIVDHIFVMEGDGVVRDFPGDYSDYRLWLSKQNKEASAVPKEEKNDRKPRPDRPQKLSFKQRKELEELETRIASLTQEKQQIETLLSSGGNPEEIRVASERYSIVSKELDDTETRWLELSIDI